MLNLILSRIHMYLVLYRLWHSKRRHRSAAAAAAGRAVLTLPGNRLSVGEETFWYCLEKDVFTKNTESANK